VRYHRVQELVHAVQGSGVDVVHVVLQSHILWSILDLNKSQYDVLNETIHAFVC
jgi:hypothetical protein